MCRYAALLKPEMYFCTLWTENANSSFSCGFRTGWHQQHIHVLKLGVLTAYPGCNSGAIGRTSDLRLISHGFESGPGTTEQWPYTNYLHLCASVAKQYYWVPVKRHWHFLAEKVKVSQPPGLWPSYLQTDCQENVISMGLLLPCCLPIRLLYPTVLHSKNRVLIIDP